MLDQRHGFLLHQLATMPVVEVPRSPRRRENNTGHNLAQPKKPLAPYTSSNTKKCGIDKKQLAKPRKHLATTEHKTFWWVIGGSIGHNSPSGCRQGVVSYAREWSITWAVSYSEQVHCVDKGKHTPLTETSKPTNIYHSQNFPALKDGYWSSILKNFF